MIKQNCFRLIKLVNNLLDVTKLDSGFLTLDRTNNNIVSIVKDITLSVTTYIERGYTEAIAVKDEGQGISKDKFNFKMFVQAPFRRSKKGVKFM